MSVPPLFHFAESYNDADQFYLSGFLCPDPFAVLELGRGKVVLAVSPMEEERARTESTGERVIALRRRKGQNLVQGLAGFIRGNGAEHVRVLPGFPLGLARELSKENIGIEVDGKSLAVRRRKKTGGQIRAIQQVQRGCESAMEMARSLLAGCPVRAGVLIFEGRHLTAERLRALIEIHLLERGLETADTIAAPGRGGARPHWRGEGPVRAGVPIVIDIFPRSRETRYHSDMSRTFVVGRASATVREMHRAVCEAQDAALHVLGAGVALDDVHKAVCDVFRRRGYGVPAGGKTPRRGFLHGTGHGLGLEVHETPSVSVTGDIFGPGDVVTVEPGLYDRRIGGVRVEDVVACMPDGSVRNLTKFPRDLEIL
ncbi:MAG: Xaa-Pro peptidase family protein [bacterium]|nr:Xaa-Pro peptidase family protein [bacterium]MDT8396125.1 Xaa-Pro peptidase family protein [bacterium]